MHLPVGISRSGSNSFTLQVGVGVPLGCEAIVHSINSTLGDDSIPLQCKWVLQIDFHNAFNLIDRHFVYEIHGCMDRMLLWLSITPSPW